MILLTSGCSWTQGDSPAQTINWDSEANLDWYNIVPNFGFYINCDKHITNKFYDSPVWPKVLGEKLGWETWNAGRGGASNRQIFVSIYNSIEYLKQMDKKDIFVVIQLTSNLRYNNFLVEEEKMVCHFETYKFLPLTGIEQLYKQNLIDLILLQTYLNSNKIPHLIYGGFDEDLSNNWRYLSDFKNVDMRKIYKKTFQPVFRHYIENTFNTHWQDNTDEWFHEGHPTNKSHIVWGEHLSEYIKENYEELL